MNGPLKFLTARKILPLLDLVATSARLLMLPKFLRCSQARKDHSSPLLRVGGFHTPCHGSKEELQYMNMY